MNLSTHPILVVGAGLSGLVAARGLRQLGYRVLVLEMAGEVGGRMATRTKGDARFDSGAQFFTVRSRRFSQLVDEWMEAGVAGLWSRGFAGASGRSRRDGHPRYRGLPTMQSIPQYLASGLPIRLNQTVRSASIDGDQWVLELKSGERVHGRGLVLTAPLPQSLALLHAGGFCLPPAIDEALQAIDYAPCLALLVEVEGTSGIPNPGGLQLHGEPILFIADNQQKGVSQSSPALTIHAGPQFSEMYWEAADEEIAALLLDDAAHWIKAPVKQWWLERWRYSIPRDVVPQHALLVPGPPALVLAGDVFNGPRVEGAALSGLAAVDALLPHLL